MSGIAKEASTTPGRWATLATWRAAWSSSTSSIRRSLAKPRPGTRIPPVRGISHVTSSIRRNSIRSDIEVHPPVPLPSFFAHDQTVVGDRLDGGPGHFDQTQRDRAAVHPDVRPVEGLHIEAGEVELPRLGDEQPLGEYVDDEVLDRLRFHHDGHLFDR